MRTKEKCNILLRRGTRDKTICSWQCFYFVDFKGIDALSRRVTQLLSDYFAPSEKGSTLKRKNLLPRGATAFFKEQAIFRMDVMHRKK